MIDLVQGSYDHSRRAKLFHLHGMSFRECMNFVAGMELEVIPYEEIQKRPNHYMAKLIEIKKLFTYFGEYLKHGYYPFVFEDVHSYFEKLIRVIDKTIFEGIANFYNLKTQNLHTF